MRPLISEFSYGYALTEELAYECRSRLLGAPIFPSLIDEGRSGGYDLQLPIIGAPLFLQFKLSHYMSRASAREWNLWGTQYYRMYLRALKHSRQHNLLLGLEAEGNTVFYAAPTFHTASKLNQAYSARQVIQNSAFFRPSAIGSLPDLEEHYVVFHPLFRRAYRYSDEPQVVEFITGEKAFETILLATNNNLQKITPPFFQHITGLMLGIIKEELRIKVTLPEGLFENVELHQIPVQAALASYLARTYFDSQLFLVSQAVET